MTFKLATQLFERGASREEVGAAPYASAAFRDKWGRDVTRLWKKVSSAERRRNDEGRGRDATPFIAPSTGERPTATAKVLEVGHHVTCSGSLFIPSVVHDDGVMIHSGGAFSNREISFVTSKNLSPTYQTTKFERLY